MYSTSKLRLLARVFSSGDRKLFGDLRLYHRVVTARVVLLLLVIGRCEVQEEKRGLHIG